MIVLCPLSKGMFHYHSGAVDLVNCVHMCGVSIQLLSPKWTCSKKIVPMVSLQLWAQCEINLNYLKISIFRIDMAAHCPYMQSACKSLVLHICRWGGSLKEFVSQLLTSCDCRLIHFRLKTPTPGPGNIHPQHFRTSLLNFIYIWDTLRIAEVIWHKNVFINAMFNDANEVFYTCIYRRILYAFIVFGYVQPQLQPPYMLHVSVNIGL